jgi:hypothetical protein
VKHAMNHIVQELHEAPKAHVFGDEPWSYGSFPEADHQKNIGTAVGGNRRDPWLVAAIL